MLKRILILSFLIAASSQADDARDTSGLQCREYTKGLDLQIVCADYKSELAFTEREQILRSDGYTLSGRILASVQGLEKRDEKVAATK